MEACQGSGAPWDSLCARSPTVPAVFHKRRTWAPPGKPPWGCAGLWAEKNGPAVKDRSEELNNGHKKRERERGELTVVRCPAPLLPPLVQVAAGAHEAADHGRDDRHEQEDGGGDASQGGGAETGQQSRALRFMKHFRTLPSPPPLQTSISLITVGRIRGGCDVKLLIQTRRFDPETCVSMTCTLRFSAPRRDLPLGLISWRLSARCWMETDGFPGFRRESAMFRSLG